MNLFNYLETHSELENALNALSYFSDRVATPDPIVDSTIFKCYTMVKGTATRRSGQIDYRKLEVELHEGYDVPGREEAHRQTLLHETAHLIVRMVWGHRASEIKAHGREWKMVMGKLGVPADRCSNNDWMQKLAAEKRAKRNVNKRVIGSISIPRRAAWYRGHYVKPGVYDVVRSFKYKKNSYTKGTVTLLVEGHLVRVTMERK